MKQLDIEPSTDPVHPNGPNWKRSEAAEQMRREAANTLIDGTMRDWWDASLGVQRQAVHVLRGKPKLGLTVEQLHVWTSANTDLGECMGAFPHAEPQAFRPEATVKVAFEACMKQLDIELSTDPDHPNGPNWKRSEAAEKRRQDIEAAKTLINGTMRDWWEASLFVQSQSIRELRDGPTFWPTGDPSYDFGFADGDLGNCMREHAFPHADPEAFRPEATVKIAFEACMKQLYIEPSTDPDHPNGPNWKRSEAAEKARQLRDQQKQKQ